MFWIFDQDSKSYLDKKLRAHRLDPIVIVGLWANECVLNTACAVSSLGKYVVLVGDNVVTVTATANRKIAFRVAESTVAKALSVDGVVRFMENDFVQERPVAMKVTRCPDGSEK